MRYSLLLAVTLLLPLLNGCQFLYPEPDADPQESNSKELQFDAEYYSLNAKVYFDGEQYARAKDQWEKQLRKQPGEWMAGVGVASCDYHLASQRLDLGDIRGARSQLESAEATLRKLWDGTIEADTRSTSEGAQAQWKAAIILALTHRALGDCDAVEARMNTQRLATMSARDPKVVELAKHSQALEQRSNANYEQALSLLEKLSAMENASEMAVLAYGELLALRGRTREAEPYFTQYLAIARKSHAGLANTREITAKDNTDPRARELSLDLLDQRIASNAKKQVTVLVRLGNMHFDAGHQSLAVARRSGLGQDQVKVAEAQAKTHFSLTLDYLEEAQRLDQDQLHLLVKMAQCQEELGAYERAIANLDDFIRQSAQRDVEPDENIHRAYRMKYELERKLKEQQSRAENR
jgi:tetratricopeptide (TPR) repeat protein